MKRFLSLAVLIAMLWGCGSVEDTPATEEKTASYKVEHYQQNIDNVEYTLVEADTETKTGTTDEETSEEAKTYEGFTAKTVEQVKITADGSSVVKIYYDRKEITLTLNLDGGEGQTEITGKYGAKVNVTAPTKSDYTFACWNPELPTTFPAESATYTARWAFGTGTVYKVEHYQENIDNDEYTLVEADTEYKTGTTDADTSAQAKTYDGFTAQEVEQVKIAADGKAVVKIYYDRKIITLKLITVKYGKEKPTITGKYGATVNVPDPTRDNYRFKNWSPMLPDTFPAEAPDYEYVGEWVKILSITYNLNGGKWIDGFTPKEKWDQYDDIYLPTAEKIEKAGCNFDGWLRGIRIITGIEDATSDVTVTAQWSVGTGTVYKVEHYQQNANDDEYTLVEADTENKTGITGEDTSAQAKTYENFTAQEVKQVKIAADGSSVVKIYYDRKIITLTLTPVKYGKKETITGKYGATVNVPDPTKDNSRFDGWNPPLPDTFPAEDNEYVGKWVKILSITYDLNGGEWIDGFTPKDKWDQYEDIYLPTAENIERAGYNFAGWLRGKRIITEILDSTSDVTVTAQWTE